jgi:SpoIID/LytB domain protein
VTLHGHGYGHGHGLSQYGAEGAARAGKGYREILRHYYPGTRLGRMRGKIRVLITADSSSDVKVSPTRGLSVRDRGTGRSWTLPVGDRIDRWRVVGERVQFHKPAGWRRWNMPGPRRTLRGDGEFFAKTPIKLWVASGGGEAARRYRGKLRASHGNTVNVLRMDSYLRGVVPAEMPASWSLNALKSQAVAARTYATNERSRNHSRYYQTCDTTSCQVYGGVAYEYASTNRAVRETARRILRYHGEPAFTQFSASSGGWTSAGGYPYLPAKKDPWDKWSGNDVHRWTTTVSTDKLERRYSSLGRLRTIRVTRRDGNGHWNGRVLRMRLEGSRNDVTISGDDFRWVYGLRSNWFTIEPTPIVARWRRIGGAKSRIGRPTSSERSAAHNGAVQRFERGRIFWHRRTGANETYGRILRAYLKMGGPKSPLRFPRTSVRRAGPDGTKVLFQRGRLYRNPPTGVHSLRSGWLRAYRRADFERGRLGMPLTDVHWHEGQRRMRFAGGNITRQKDRDFVIRYS